MNLKKGGGKLLALFPRLKSSGEKEFGQLTLCLVTENLYL